MYINSKITVYMSMNAFSTMNLLYDVIMDLISITDVLYFVCFVNDLTLLCVIFHEPCSLKILKLFYVILYFFTITTCN